MNRRRGRRLLVLLVLATALPFGAAWLFFFNPQWLPEPTAQHGTLLTDPIPVDTLALRTLEGQPLALTVPANALLLVAIEPGTCALPCRERQVGLRQARRAAGIEKDRVVRVLAFATPPDADTRESLTAESPDLALALADEPLLSLAAGNPTLLLGEPRGTLILSYDAATVAIKDVLKDLKRLLRVSRSW
jgi:hypothetical protein